MGLIFSRSGISPPFFFPRADHPRGGQQPPDPRHPGAGRQEPRVHRLHRRHGQDRPPGALGQGHQPRADLHRPRLRDVHQGGRGQVCRDLQGHPGGGTFVQSWIPGPLKKKFNIKIKLIINY